jgi:hypothetical protein
MQGRRRPATRRHMPLTCADTTEWHRCTDAVRHVAVNASILAGPCTDKRGHSPKSLLTWANRRFLGA